MAKDLKNNTNQDLSLNCEYQGEQSFVDKVRDNISKWFSRRSTTFRKRDASDSEEIETPLKTYEPPSKRTKLRSDQNLELDVSKLLSPIARENDIRQLPATVSSSVRSSTSSFSCDSEPIAGPSGYQSTCRQFAKNNNSAAAPATVERNSVFKNSVFKNPEQIPNSYKGGGISVDNKTSISDSEESTSGYSSGRIGSKEVISQASSKQTSPGASPMRSRCFFENTSERSLFNNSLDRHNTTRSKNPIFEPYVYKTPIAREKVTARILNSPFYRGRTIYGGAAAYSRRTNRPTEEFKKSLRKSISIKPVNTDMDKSNAQLGITARRILDTLQQYNTLITDAKKIPISAKKPRMDSSLVKNYSTASHSFQGSRTPLKTELQVPQVTELLKMKMDQQKTRLQKSTEAVRKIAAKSKSVLNETTYQVAIHNTREKAPGKMKTKITSQRPKQPMDETLPELKLNPVALPIKELPKFNFVIQPPSSTLDDNPCLTNTDRSAYEFSAPIVLGRSTKPIQGLNSFKFSEPTIKKRRSIHSLLEKNNGEIANDNNIRIHENILLVRANQSNESYRNIKGKSESSDSLPPPPSSSSSSSSSSPPAVAVATTTPFGDKFKAPTNTWECPTCLIRNKQEQSKCIACETLKPSSTSKCQTEKIVFVPPPKTWECSVCMIRNKDELENCAACQAKKPGSGQDSRLETADPPTLQGVSSFGNDFRKKDDEWECDVCMVRNKSEHSKCQCCQSPRPGATAAASMTAPATANPALSTCNLGLGKTSVVPFTFGIPPKLQQQTNNTVKSNIIFGQNQSSSESSAKFTFGVVKSTKDNAEVSKSDNDVGSKKETKSTNDSIAPSGGFTFGSKESVADAKAQTSNSNTTTSLTTTTNLNTSKFAFGPGNKKQDEVEQSKGNVFGSFPNPITKENSFKTEVESDDLSTKEELTKKRKSLDDKTPASTTSTPMFKGPSTTSLPSILPFSNAKTDVKDGPTSSPLSNTSTKFNLNFNASSKLNSFVPPPATPSASSLQNAAATASTSNFPKLDTNFKFGSTAVKPTNEFKINTASTPLLFGGTTETKPFTFGSAKTTANHSTALPSFATVATATTASTSFIDASSGITQAPSFSFNNPLQTAGGGATAATTTASSGVALGGGKLPVFSFSAKPTSSTIASTNSAVPAFNFSSPQMQPVSQLSSMPSFNFSGSAANGNKQPSTTMQMPTFNAAPNNGTMANGLFFNSGTTANNQGNNLASGSGALGAAPTGNGSTGGFNFSTTKLPETSGGFQFSGINSMATTNFTGGNSIPTFSAQPATTTMQRKDPPRKVKKAIRRFAS